MHHDLWSPTTNGTLRWIALVSERRSTNEMMRLLKFDAIYPARALERIHDDARVRFPSMSRSEYLRFVLAYRANFSDYMTHNLPSPDWHAEEFLINDRWYIAKVAGELENARRRMVRRLRSLDAMVRRQPRASPIVEDYLNRYRPDVIFVREHAGYPSSFWRQFRDRALVVCQIASSMPYDYRWHPADFDAIATSVDALAKFFELHNVKVLRHENGFDRRLLSEIPTLPRIHDLVYVGDIDPARDPRRFQLLEKLARTLALQWWGPKPDAVPEDSALRRAYRGFVFGIGMFEVLAASKIAVNDYGTIADGMGVNQRICEALGSGALLLTRSTPTLLPHRGAMVLFDDDDDCVAKARYFLAHDDERLSLAREGRELATSNLDYRKVMIRVGAELQELYRAKFGSRAPRWR